MYRFDIKCAILLLKRKELRANVQKVGCNLEYNVLGVGEEEGISQVISLVSIQQINTQHNVQILATVVLWPI